jgi:anti-sigma factor RsiW
VSDQPNIRPDDHLSEEQLMAYLEGKLPAAQQRRVEEFLSAEGMESDALDGLRTMPPSDIRASTERLNHRLRVGLSNKKRKRRKLNTGQMTWIAVLLTLFLAVVAYIAIKRAL